MGEIVNRIMGAFAEIIFLLCVGAHVATLVRMWEPSERVVGVLYLIVVLLLIPMGLALNRLNVEHAGTNGSLDFWKVINEFLPWHTQFVCYGALFYTVLIAMFLMFSAPHGPIEKVGPDAYVMRNKGQVVQRLNEEQARRIQARQDAIHPERAGSGLMMILALFPAVVFRRIVPAMDARKTERLRFGKYW